MRLKTFTAPDMPAALRLLRTELGPDALILSTRKVGGKNGNPTLEITAALPESPPQTSSNLPFTSPEPPHSPIVPPAGQPPTAQNPLAAHSLPPDLLERLTTAMQGLASAGFSGTDALEMVLPKIIALQTRPQQLQAGACHVFIGPHGAGKTTLMGKLALQAAQAGKGKIGLLSLDDRKIAGFEPLAIAAEAIGDTAVLLRTPSDLKTAAKELGPRPLMLVDTPGFSGAEGPVQGELLRRLEALGLPFTCHLVLPANLHPQELPLLPAAYQRFAPASLIATKIDVTGHLGGIVAAAARHNLPLGVASHSPAMDTPPITLTAHWLAQALGQPPLLPWEHRS